ncbi:MAG TPA: sterol desaturase family protein [Polyangia bacterium]|jgi:sterol desaturase/sphingolipid hydroxylase (fatty acid hydroxylase superfamily)|nr:sterol desaturase family protein [Polyangia bacterium]
MQALVTYVLDRMPYGSAAALFLGENLTIFALALLGGAVLARGFAGRRVCALPPPLEAREIGMAAMTVLLNTAVTLAGLWLYRRGLVRFRGDLGWRALADVVVLLVVMDAAMYGLHRLAHVEPLFRWLHAPHHRYDRPRPLTLFVLSPPEALAFGGLWLVVLMLYPCSWLGMSIYLGLNVAFGVVGHLGVEPGPRGLVRVPLARSLATSTFHAQHHADRDHNFGFYTLVWDRLFGTLAPDYARDFERAAGASPPGSEGVSRRAS